MNMKKILCFLFAAFTIAVAQAQTASDALRFSYIPQYGGTARTIGVGGAMGALGGDFATISMNPAGLATYRMSEFTFTPGFHGARAKSELLNSGTGATTQRSTNFSTDNLGLVFAHQPTNSKWKTFNYSFGYNRFQDFNSSTFYEGTTKGSMTARWRDAANIDKNFDPFEGKLAAEAGAIYRGVLSPGSRDTLWITDFDKAPSNNVRKNQIIETSGSLGEMSFAVAGNYDEKLQLGITIGVPILRYTESKIYREENTNKQIPEFNKLQYEQNLTTSGSNALASGVNVKLGAIIRPTQFLRVGLAVHSPTTFWLNDRYDATLTYDYTFKNVTYNTPEKSPEGDANYTLTTPWRALGSVAFMFGKSGFLSADVEWADHSKANFGYDKKYISDQNEVNKTITERYKSAVNARFGGEYVYDIFRLRAGIGLNTSPRTDKDFVNVTYSAGAGIRGKSFFMDLGWQNRTQKENYTPYKLVESQANLEQKVTTAYAFNDFLLTFGIRF
jgi:hypothetical protein